MRPFTLSPQVLYSDLVTSITSATLATGIRRSSTVQQTHRRANWTTSRTSKRQPWTRRSASRKTNTGRHRTRRRRMAWDAGASATQILSTSRASRAAVSRSGWMWQAAGLAHRRGQASGRMRSRRYQVQVHVGVLLCGIIYLFQARPRVCKPVGERASERARSAALFLLLALLR